MNKIVLGALALTAASSPSLAGTENSWSAADRDLAGLASSLTQGASSAAVSGFLRSSYASSSDITVGTGDLGGFSIDDAQLWFNGSIGQFAVTIQTEASSSNNLAGSVGTVGDLNVLDAYASWNMTEQFQFRIGNFRPAFLSSSAKNENNLLFINRSFLGGEFAFRDAGAQAGATFGLFNIQVYAQNGGDSAADELAYGFRAEVTLMGAPAAHEGALGAAGDPSLAVGLGYYTNDGANTDEVAMGLDANFTVGVFGVSAEMVDFDNFTPSATSMLSGTFADATPYNFAASFCVMPDRLELAARYEDMDDSDNTTAITVGANWYLQGHAAKWQANYVTTDSDNTAFEADIIQIGLTVSI